MREANQQFSSIHTKTGNGEQLDEIEIALIESRFCIVKEAELSSLSSLQPSIWFCDVHGVTSLVGRGKRDFLIGDTMGVKETSAMELWKCAF
ncbi:hypothetical protein TNCV_3469491 [Trichonephila clavipes]|nr:hypothetical protein TNCV_3469491 [Trichonephila clavipes]